MILGNLNRALKLATVGWYEDARRSAYMVPPTTVSVSLPYRSVSELGFLLVVCLLLLHNTCFACKHMYCAGSPNGAYIAVTLPTVCTGRE